MKLRVILFAAVGLSVEAMRLKTSKPDQNGYNALGDFDGHANRTVRMTMVAGSACSCAGVAWTQNTCCGEGLICSRKDKVCKPAIGGACTSSMFGTNCAVGSYGAGHMAIGCYKFHGAPGGKRCCISGIASMIQPGTALANYLPLSQNDPSSCCSGEFDSAPHHWFGSPDAGKANAKNFCK